MPCNFIKVFLHFRLFTVTLLLFAERALCAGRQSCFLLQVSLFICALNDIVSELAFRFFERSFYYFYAHYFV